MKIKLLAVGTQMPAWVTQGYLAYAKRIPPTITLQLREIALTKRSKNADYHKMMQAEGKEMLSYVESTDKVIALAIKGRQYSTEQLASELQNWLNSGRNVALMIGGPEGLAPECLNRAETEWSLSALTLPHPIVRVIVIEQLYRAWSILQHHPYHR